MKANFGKRAFAHTFAPILSKTLVMVAQLAPLCQHFFYKVCPKTVRRSVPFLPRFARFYSILLYIGGAKTHFFAGKKIFAPPRRKCGFRRQFSTKAAENSHPAGGKIRPLFRCFTRVFHGGKSARKIGWQRRFFTQFSGKIYAVFFIIIYIDSMVRNCPRGRMICRSRLPLCSEGADRRFDCAETAVRRRAHSASAGNADAVGDSRRFHRTAKQSFACTRRMYRVFCTPLVVVFPCGTRCRGAGMFHMKHSGISQRRDAALPSRNVSCETFYPTQM